MTPNKFEEFVEKPDNPQTARSARNHVYKQLLTCPFCGKPLKEENFNINTDRKSIEIFCSDRDCQFYRYKNDRIPTSFQRQQSKMRRHRPDAFTQERIRRSSRRTALKLATVSLSGKFPWRMIRSESMWAFALRGNP